MTHRSCLFIALTAVFSLQSFAQDQWRWPERPQNLQVLPDSFTGRQLNPVMRGFTRSLGVRCQYCHVGEEGKSLSTFDFVSDANPNKERAREMLRMLGDINDHLKKIDKSGDKAVNMWCHTCHRGRPRPMTIEEELGEVYRTRGIEPAVAHYKDLKARFLTKGAYNFGEDGLNSFGYSVLATNDFAASIRAFTLLTEEFPESANAWDSLAEAYMKSGDKANAVRYYEKSLVLDPKNENATKMLESLKK